MANFHLRRVTEKDAELLVDLTVEGDHTFVVRDQHDSQRSFVASNCWLTPVISYVTFDQFV